MQSNGYGRGAGKADRGLVYGKTRVRIHDLCPGLAKHQASVKHSRFAARLHHYVIWIDLHAPIFFDIFGHRLTQFRNAISRGIAMVTIRQSLAPGLHNIFRRLEVGLADAKVDDFAALGGQCVGPGQNFECCFRAQAVHSIRKFHGPGYGMMGRWTPPVTSVYSQRSSIKFCYLFEKAMA